jgi:hypothetical protein
VACHETTASTLNWISYLLLEYPAVEAKLHAEIDGLLSDEIPSFDDLTTLVLSRMRSVNAISLLIFPFPWVSDDASVGSLLWWRCRFIWAQSPNIFACGIFPSVPSSLSRTLIFARGPACT